MTRERIQEIIARIEMFGHGAGYTVDEVYELASMALAAMDSDPVAVTDDELDAALQLHRLKVDGHSQLSDAFRAGFRYARRTPPQPAPVVPPMQHWEELCREHPDMSIGDAIIRAAWWNHCRAAMLNGGNDE